jgi:hypothetical protein
MLGMQPSLDEGYSIAGKPVQPTMRGAESSVSGGGA